MAIDNVVYGYMVDEQGFSDKKVIIEENSKGDWVFIVLEGQVKMKKRTKKGIMTLGTLSEGAVFGEMSLFQKWDKTRNISVEADGPVKVGILDTARLDREIEALSPQLRGLIRTLAKRFEETVENIGKLAGE